jgi:hypothetical protein
MVQSEVRIQVTKRLIASSRRWTMTGNLARAQHQSNAEESLRKGRRILALVSVIRASKYADVIPDQFLKDHARKSAGELVELIAARFPKSEIPGYVDR